MSADQNSGNQAEYGQQYTDCIVQLVRHKPGSSECDDDGEKRQAVSKKRGPQQMRRCERQPDLITHIQLDARRHMHFDQSRPIPAGEQSRTASFP